MPSYSDDLLRVAERLHTRRSGQKGPIKSAAIRRSISTSYYALFHFVLDETALRLIGAGGHLLQRRRIFIRTLSHTGLAFTFGKLKGRNVEQSVAELFRLAGAPSGAVANPAFVQRMALTFLDAKAMREDADYSLNEPFGEGDARRLHAQVVLAIADWKAAATQADRDAKHVVAVLLSLRGRLRD